MKDIKPNQLRSVGRLLAFCFIFLSANSSCLINDDVAPIFPMDPIDDITLMFNSSPANLINHNKEFIYQIFTLNTGLGPVIYDVSIPSWLTFDKSTSTISGIADWENVGKSFNMLIEASNNSETITQTFILTVTLGEIICNQDFGDPNNSPYILPFKTGDEYLLNQSYCPDDSSWGHNNWFAYDFEMDIGQTLIACRGGEVIAIKESNPDIPDCSGGKENYVFILHNDGTVMSYVHLMENGVTVEVGDQIEPGQEIGFSGNSGCSSGPHTHIALFRDRSNYDRQSTLPFNFSNAEGPLDSNNGLIQGEHYLAL